jgi:hypothetical protein
MGCAIKGSVKEKKMKVWRKVEVRRCMLGVGLDVTFATGFPPDGSSGSQEFQRIH